MTEVIEGNQVKNLPRAGTRPALLRQVPLYYGIALNGHNGLRLLRVSLGFGEEALALFSSWEAAQNFYLSDVFRGEWYTRECSSGELVSLLLGPYEGIEWVLLDPCSEGHHPTRDSQTSLMNRERFLSRLLD